MLEDQHISTDNIVFREPKTTRYKFIFGVVAGVWEEDDPETLWWPLLVDVGLVWLFIAQHTFMALGFWKQLLEGLGMGSVSRLIYVFATSVTLQVSTTVPQ